MKQAQPAKEKLYRRVKSGDGRALPEILEAERPELFDFLLRMTGQVSKSTETVDEVFQSLNEDALDATGSYIDLRLMLFSTARRFTTDVWNAETPRLVNAALEGGSDVDQPTDKVQRERSFYRPLDKSLRGLPGREREVVLLRARGGFDWDEIAQVMGIGSTLIERTFVDGIARIERECPGVVGAEAALAKLPAHPEPMRSSQRTINLSMVMQGIKAKPVGLWSPLRFGVVAIGLGVVGILIFQPGLLTHLAAAVRGLLTEERGNGP